MDGYQPTKQCEECKGVCCKGSPCEAFPEDFGSSEAEVIEGVKRAIRTRRWCLDWWEGDVKNPGNYDGRTRCLYVRPCVKGHEGEISHASWGGECTFLGDDGCALPFDRRPRGGRMLKPRADEDGRCVSGCGSKAGSAEAWYDYDLEGVIDSLREEGP